MTSKVISLGERLNNPLNMRYSEAVKWQGLDEQSPSEQGFCRFKSPDFGIRAAARQLIKYQDDYDCHTIENHVTRWAPPTENKTVEYIRHVVAFFKRAGRMEVEKDTMLDVQKYDDLLLLLTGMMVEEIGAQPYAQAVVDKGLLMAGVQPPIKPLQQTKTIKAAQVATAGTTLGMLAPAAGAIAPAVPLLQSIAQYAPMVLGVIVLAAIGFIAYDRWDNHRKGL